mgnify:CR=1 FL=1
MADYHWCFIVKTTKNQFMKKPKKIVRGNLIFTILFLLLPLLGKSQQLCGQSYKNFVPDSVTAIKIAEAIWLPIYGESIDKEKPFMVTLIGDSIWFVEGSTLPQTIGGTAEIKIRKSDCKILSVCHGK